MNETQKKLLQTFPAADRGLFGPDVEDDEKAPDLVAVEDDFVEAAVLKAKLKQKAMRERKLAREDGDEEAAKKRVRWIDDEQVESDNGDDDDGLDSEELVYDSEEEDKAEQEYQQKKQKEKDAEKKINTEEFKT